jgi:hypothetical protein
MKVDTPPAWTYNHLRIGFGESRARLADGTQDRLRKAQRCRPTSNGHLLAVETREWRAKGVITAVFPWGLSKEQAMPENGTWRVGRE